MWFCCLYFYCIWWQILILMIYCMIDCQFLVYYFAKLSSAWKGMQHKSFFAKIHKTCKSDSTWVGRSQCWLCFPLIPTTRTITLSPNLNQMEGMFEIWCFFWMSGGCGVGVWKKQAQYLLYSLVTLYKDLTSSACRCASLCVKGEGNSTMRRVVRGIPTRDRWIF